MEDYKGSYNRAYAYLKAKYGKRWHLSRKFNEALRMVRFAKDRKEMERNATDADYDFYLPESEIAKDETDNLIYLLMKQCYLLSDAPKMELHNLLNSLKINLVD